MNTNLVNSELDVGDNIVDASRMHVRKAKQPGSVPALENKCSTSFSCAANSMRCHNILAMARLLMRR